MNEPLLIIPDVHGRPFWEDIVDRYPQSHVIFLGDYLDPYPDEHITTDDAGINYFGILLYKYKYGDRVTLLLGNHDLHYIDNDLAYSRKQNNDWLKLLWGPSENANYSEFDVAYSLHLGNKDYLLTHAGVLPQWWQRHFSNVPMDADSIAKTLNDKFHKNPLAFSREALEDVSIYRGGNLDYGSCMWAHIDEHLNSPAIPNVYQIFGHTQFDKPQIYPNFADLDCYQAFLLDSEGQLHGIES